MAVIPRDIDHPYNDADPEERIMFLQHGVAIPDSFDMVDRAGVVNPILLPRGDGTPQITDRRVKLMTPDTVAALQASLFPGMTNVQKEAITMPTPDLIPGPDRAFVRRLGSRPSPEEGGPGHPTGARTLHPDMR